MQNLRWLIIAAPGKSNACLTRNNILLTYKYCIEILLWHQSSSVIIWLYATRVFAFFFFFKKISARHLHLYLSHGNFLIFLGVQALCSYHDWNIVCLILYYSTFHPRTCCLLLVCMCVLIRLQNCHASPVKWDRQGLWEMTILASVKARATTKHRIPDPQYG